VFQYLKYWHGSTAVLGILVIPGILGLLLVRLLLRSPTEKMTSGGTQPVGNREDEMKLLIEYLQSLK
jgi:hypothetical protein